MEDSEILGLFAMRSEKAIAETDKKYGRYCRFIAYGILRNDDDANEIVNDTFLRLWNSIPPASPASLKSYIGTVCRRLSLTRAEKNTTEKRGGGETPLVYEELSEVLPSGDDPADMDFSDDGALCVDPCGLGDTLNTFLQTLSVKTRRIFIRRYWFLVPIPEIAEEFGMTVNAVTVSLFTTRKKLKKYLKKEGYDYD